ncbi:MAG TPA: cob(I)yrinic acid a,c-diamide adenosyltransferase [Vicinamibacterales bacterium]|nr:cob(I)yrinic acid a,c-diamide adenosyltransferase [Vicinamibacterales bacterium]
MKLYTKTGDGGETALLDGTRVSKAEPRVSAYGDIDELGAWLGLARAAGPDETTAARLERIQRDLFAIGARLADPSRRVAGRTAKAAIDNEDVGRLESWIDELQSRTPPLRRFVLAGGSPAGAALHVARTVCRRAERGVVALGPGAVDPPVLAYLNRLSDLLFAMARAVNQEAGIPEREW